MLTEINNKNIPGEVVGNALLAELVMWHYTMEKTKYNIKGKQEREIKGHVW